MATIHKFEDLEIWQLAFQLYKTIAAISVSMRQKHDYRFAEQIKAASGSIMDNIAEGFERSSRLEFLNSLSISKSECGELKSQAYRCLEDGYINKQEFEELYTAIDTMTKKIATLIAYLNKSTVRGLKFKDRTIL